jgi:PAS domain S-box-containing protein
MDAAEEADLFAFLSGEPPPQAKPAAARRTLWAGLSLLALILAAAIVIPALLVADRRATLETELDQRLRILAESRAQVLAAWLEGNSRVAARISESELFRLFVTEVAMTGGDLSEVIAKAQDPLGNSSQSGDVNPLVLQLPYMKQLLTDFVRDSDFLSAYLIGSRGDVLIQSNGASHLSATGREMAKKLFREATLPFGPVRAAASGLVADIVLPVFPVQSESGGGRPAAVLLLTTPIRGKLAEVLSPGALSLPGERLRLIQHDDGALVEIAPGESSPVRALSAVSPFDGDGDISFARRMEVGGGQLVYSAGAAVPGTLWWIVQEAETAAAEADFNAFERSVIAVAGLVVLSVAVALAAIWWRMAEGHSRSQAEQYRALAGRIERQRRLLDSINSTIADYIGLKDLDGGYRYVNAAFARALGRSAEQLVGQNDAAIFGLEAAHRLELSDAQARKASGPVTGDYEVVLGNKSRRLQISKVAFSDETGKVSGIVSVGRDVTELVEARRRREQAMSQLVTALVRAIEFRDPYLAGHSKRVAEFAAETARQLGAEPEEIATVEMAANLSQIGKLAIPRALLTKAERLDDDEIALMQGHIEHAESALKGIEFDLPILETIRQMHERLDGTGYPDGLAAGAISRTGLILGACDVFCARIEPRSYRRGIDPQAALAILQQNDSRYDSDVVSALCTVVQSAAGEKLIASVETS